LIGFALATYRGDQHVASSDPLPENVYKSEHFPAVRAAEGFPERFTGPFRFLTVLNERFLARM
jgi:hypothetical protein